MPSKDYPQTAAELYKPLRIWIPILLLPLMVVARFIPSWFPEVEMIWMAAAFGPGLIGLLLIGWWLALSRARWFERLPGLIGLILVLVVTAIALHPTMRGAPFVVMTLPLAIAGFMIGSILLYRTLSFRRTAVAILFSLLFASVTALLKNDGSWGNFAFGLDWRWKQTAEDIFLAGLAKKESQGKTVDRTPTRQSFEKADWPGFRGPSRDGTQRGKSFSSNWKENPPEEVWRIPVGPAWSSFAFADGFLLTQEQRNDQEAVVCYDAENGKEVWVHLNESRFFDDLGGLGPRSTPAIADGSVFAFGAEGWLERLNAETGECEWKVDVRKVADRSPPMWGFSCSPLIADGLVVIHAGGKEDKGILAFDIANGELRWSVPASTDGSYSSVHEATLFDQKHLVLLSGDGALFLDPKTGKTTLDYPCKINGYRALQPAFPEPNRMLIPGEFMGTRMIELSQSESGLDAKEVWTSRGLKSDFNDAVVHQGHYYGYDGGIFSCIDLKDGKRKWKNGRYGKGQVILLADSDLLVVVAETGELVLLEATAEGHRELAKMPALDGKTWNHPIVVQDRLYIRNANEAVCYRLTERESD